MATAAPHKLLSVFRSKIYMSCRWTYHYNTCSALLGTGSRPPCIMSLRRPQITADMATPSTMYELDCDSCPELCDDCFVHSNHAHTCELVPAHTSSNAPGGELQSLHLDPGYWRSSFFSKEILECYEATACIGGGGEGVTNVDSYCGDAYTGPCECWLPSS